MPPLLSLPLSPGRGYRRKIHTTICPALSKRRHQHWRQDLSAVPVLPTGPRTERERTRSSSAASKGVYFSCRVQQARDTLARVRSRDGGSLSPAWRGIWDDGSEIQDSDERQASILSATSLGFSLESQVQHIRCIDSADQTTFFLRSVEDRHPFHRVAVSSRPLLKVSSVDYMICWYLCRLQLLFALPALSNVTGSCS